MKRALALSRGLLSGPLESPEGARRRELASKRKLACQKRPCAPLWRVYLASPRGALAKKNTPHLTLAKKTAPHLTLAKKTTPHLTLAKLNLTSPHPANCRVRIVMSDFFKSSLLATP